MPLNHRWRRTLLLAGLFCVLTAPALAEPTTDDKTLSPYFFIEGDPTVDRLPLAKTDVKVDVAGVIANVRVTQTYKNEGSRPIHAEYVFPGSTRAAVHGMRMKIGERRDRREDQRARSCVERVRQSKGRRQERIASGTGSPERVPDESREHSAGRRH